MRLGSYPCALVEGSLASQVYGKAAIQERHRHRFELNNKFRKLLKDAGLSIAGLHSPKSLIEIVELKPSSGRAMTWGDYRNGRRVGPGDRFTIPD